MDMAFKWTHITGINVYGRHPLIRIVYYYTSPENHIAQKLDSGKLRI